MQGDRRLSLIVGGFVVATLLGLAFAILSLSSESGYFVPRYHLVAHFDNVQGLLAGAPVWLGGKEVGRVEQVSFNPTPGAPPMQVQMRIVTEVQERIREDSVARIGTIGVLGDSYVEVSLGTLSAPVLGDGAEIEAVTPSSLSEVMEGGTRALGNVASLAANLNEVVGSFREGEGGRKAAEAVGAVTNIVTQVEEGHGLLHSMIFDEYTAGGIESIERSLATLEDILGEVAAGDGILHSLIYDSPTEQDLVMEALEAGARLNSILAKVDRGEGTVGLLLNDPTLYEDLKILLGGAQRSFVVRNMIRMTAEGR